MIKNVCKGWSLLACFLFWSGILQAQGYSGSIKNDKAFITISTTAFRSIEELSKLWGVTEVEIISVNPGLVSDLFPRSNEILIPVGSIIKSSGCDSCKPVYHHVGKSEGLYRIGKCYGNTTAATLKKMNNLRSDALKLGQELLVGYVAPGSVSDMEPGTSPVSSVQGTPMPVQPVPIPVEPVKDPAVAAPRPELVYTGTGVFESEFAPDPSRITTKTGKAASFKTESGWKDGRFYLLNSQLQTGVVVKVTNPGTGKSIYAKVVGPLPKIKQNNKLDWRLSSAAAASLGVWNEDEIMDLVIEF